MKPDNNPASDTGTNRYPLFVFENSQANELDQQTGRMGDTQVRNPNEPNQINFPTHPTTAPANLPIVQNSNLVIASQIGTPAHRGYLQDLPEQSIMINCPYCLIDVNTIVERHFNLCCWCLFIFCAIMAVLVILDGLLESCVIFILPALIFLGLSFLSRIWKHHCLKCKRELGRGQPKHGCCTTNIT